MGIPYPLPVPGMDRDERDASVRDGRSRDLRGVHKWVVLRRPGKLPRKTLIITPTPAIPGRTLTDS